MSSGSLADHNPGIVEEGALEKTQSTTYERPLPPPSDEIPNGGFAAWMQVLGAFFLFFNSWGLVNSFGSFQTYYQSNLLRDQTPSNISWIGSIQTCCMMLTGTFAGRGVDAGYFKELLVFGTVASVFGMMMTSLANSFWQIVLAQGFLTGIALGCLFLPGTTVLVTWFSTRRSLAVGISASGSSLGGVIYPIMLRHLFDRLGFPWATRVLAFIMLGTLTMATMLMRSRLPPRKSGPLIEPGAFKDVPYTLFTAGMTIGFMGLWTPFFYIGDYALSVGIDANMAFYLLSIMNAASAMGRIVPNLFADKIGPINTLTPCCGAAAVLIFAWIGIKSLAGLIVFAILYGFVTGTLVSLPPTAIAVLCPDLSRLGTMMGMTFSIAAFALLSGPPISGAIINSSSLGFTGAFVFAGSVATAGFCLWIVTRLTKAGPKLFVRI